MHVHFPLFFPHAERLGSHISLTGLIIKSADFHEKYLRRARIFPDGNLSYAYSHSHLSQYRLYVEIFLLAVYIHGERQNLTKAKKEGKRAG